MIFPFDLRGPDFLVFYVVTVVVTLICLSILRRRLDSSYQAAPPLLPENLDPRWLAWLRGGTDELARLTGLDLLQRGYLRQRKNGKTTVIENSPQPPSLEGLSTGAVAMMNALKNSRRPRQILQDTGAALAWENEKYEAQAQAESLLTDERTRAAVKAAGVGFGLFLIALGVTKIWIGISRDRPVGLLTVLTIAAPFLVWRWSRLPRLSWRGRAYLKQAQDALVPLRRQAASMPTDDPLLLVAAGAFGLEALAATSFAPYSSFYHPVVSGGSSCSGGGSSCGSDSSSGSSCSSGSGSSCSGGSSCSSGSSCGGCSSS